MFVCSACGTPKADVDAGCDECGARPKALRVRRPAVVSFVICVGVLLCGVVPIGLLTLGFVMGGWLGPTAVNTSLWVFLGGLGVAVIVGAVVYPEIDWGASVGARLATRVAVWVYVGLLVLVAAEVMWVAIALFGGHCDTGCE